MKWEPTDAQRVEADKQQAIIEAAERVSRAEIQEINKRHQGYKRRAKNLAGIKGACLPALAFERLILAERLDQIDKEMGQ